MSPLPAISRRALTAMLASGLCALGCGGGSGDAPFFKNALGDRPVVQTVPMVHGFTLLLVDEVPSRTDTTFTFRFKAPEPLDFTLVDGQYQEGISRPKVEVNGKPVDVDRILNSTAAEATFSVVVNKLPGKETKSSHQIRLEVFSNGELRSTAVTPVELEFSGPPGARYDLSLHQGPADAPR